MKREPYTSEEIRTAVEKDRERLFAFYSVGRPPGWNVDHRTKDLVTIGSWLREEMRRLELDDLGRITQEGRYNRLSRSTEDLFILAAEIMNDTLADRIDRNRVAHRRWG